MKKKIVILLSSLMMVTSMTTTASASILGDKINEIKTTIDEVKSQIKSEIETVNSTIDAVKTEIKADIEKVKIIKSKIESNVENIKNEVKEDINAINEFSSSINFNYDNSSNSNYDFSITTVSEPKNLISGRFNSSNMQDTTNEIEISFSENYNNKLLSYDSLDFNMPNGVKIVGAEITEKINFSSNVTDIKNSDLKIINNGQTLRIKPENAGNYKPFNKGLIGFKLKLTLSVAPGFAGDIKCILTNKNNVKGEGVIAKAQSPIDIKFDTTKIGTENKEFNTSDIYIKEIKPGMFIQGKNVEIGLEGPFKNGENFGFLDANCEIRSPELEIKQEDFNVNNGKIKFKIDKATQNEPATILIKNIKVSSNRSIPLGVYKLDIGGDALINNYVKNDISDKDKVYTADKNVNQELTKQSKQNYFRYNNYINVVGNENTETTSYQESTTNNTSSNNSEDTNISNNTVKVTIGQKNVIVNGQTMDMDVAPYIQPSSNSGLVPLRFVTVALGSDNISSKVEWDANSKTVVIYYGSGFKQKIIQFQADSNIMVVDGKKINMENGVKAELKDGRMFVPFRMLGNALGVSVDWDSNTKTAIFN